MSLTVIAPFSAKITLACCSVVESNVLTAIFVRSMSPAMISPSFERIYKSERFAAITSSILILPIAEIVTSDSLPAATFAVILPDIIPPFVAEIIVVELSTVIVPVPRFTSPSCAINCKLEFATSTLPLLVVIPP